MNIAALRAATLLVATSHALATPLPESPDGLHASPVSVPVSFEQNLGQAAGEVKYLSRGLAGALFLTNDDAVWVGPGGSSGVSLRMSLQGARADAATSGELPIPTHSNYLTGNRPSHWRVGVPHYAQVRRASVYPGIDLVLHPSADARLEYDFVLAPGADPENIRLAFTGMQAVRVNEGGDLVLSMHGGELVQHAPEAYQDVHGTRVPVPASFKLNDDGSVGFQIAAYDADRPLVIDPVISFSTYLGDAFTTIKDIKVMPDGSAYLYGHTTFADLPTTAGAYQGTLAGSADAFVAKLAADGTHYEFLTYLGGSGDEANGGSIGPGIAIDGQGGIYVTGRTDSTDFPLLNALQPSLVGGTDFYVTKLDRTGSRLIYSTYLGGPDFVSDQGTSPSEAGPTIAVDRTGNAHIMGYTNADGYPVVNAYQDHLAGGLDGVLTKLDARGTSILFSTYIGGSSDDKPRGIAVDGNGFVLITGRTDSRDYPRVRPLQGIYGGRGDISISRFTPTGSLDFSTFWGGSNTEKGRAITLDRRGNLYLTGNTQSTDFPTVSPLQADLAGGGDIFVMRVAAALDHVIYATYLGGLDDDEGSAIAADNTGNVFVAGYTQSADFPVVAPFQTGLAGVQDAVVLKINSRGSAITYSSPLGGSGSDEGIAIGVDLAGQAYIVGSTTSSDFPVVNPLQTGTAGAFLTKITP